MYYVCVCVRERERERERREVNIKIQVNIKIDKKNSLYIHVCLYVRMHVCIYVCLYVCKYVCMYVFKILLISDHVARDPLPLAAHDQLVENGEPRRACSGDGSNI